MARISSNKQKTPWEIAKDILRKWYIEGTITDAMKPADVYAMHPDFASVKYPNFRSNFARLKKTIREHWARAEEDQIAYLHDMTIHTLAKDTKDCWHGSEAQELLKEDIKRKRHEKMKPELLWITRPQYQEYSLKKFRGHIHQELRSTRETNYWIVKKRKQKQMQLAIRAGKRINEDDVDFLYDPVLDM